MKCTFNFCVSVLLHRNYSISYIEEFLAFGCITFNSNMRNKTLSLSEKTSIRKVELRFSFQNERFL